MNANFEPWVRERLADNRYVGMVIEEDSVALASAGIFFADFPHFLDVKAGRPYLTNFYSAPEARGRGRANQLLTDVWMCAAGEDMAP